MIALSIDVSKLDRNRIKEVRLKNGNLAKFLELVLIETPGGKYGDYMVKQGISKEEREAKVQMPILGNAKNVGGQKRAAPTSNRRQASNDDSPPWDDSGLANQDIPF